MRKASGEKLLVAGREVTITNAAKVLFPAAGHTKLDVARYYVAVADGALRGAGARPNMLVRYPNGIDGEFFYQKRAPTARPAWIEVVTIRFPSGRSADEVVPRNAAALVWLANLACLELHPHPVRAGARHVEVVEGGTSRRLHRLQPERARPYGRRCLFRTSDTRCDGFDADHLGRTGRLRTGCIHVEDRAGPLCGAR